MTVQDYLFCMTQNVRGGKAIPSTQDEINKARESEHVIKTAKEVVELTEKLRNPELTKEEYDALDKEKKAKKLTLPAVCYHASKFKDGKRSNDGAKASGYAFFDGDHVVFDIDEFYKKMIEPNKHLWGIILFEKSVSRDGFHLVFKKPKGMDIKTAQQWMGSKLGLKCDDVSDLARACYLPPKENVLWQSEWKKDDELMVEDAVIVKEVKEVAEPCTAPSADAEPNSALNADEADAEEAKANSALSADEADAEEAKALAMVEKSLENAELATKQAVKAAVKSAVVEYKLEYARQVFDLCVAEARLTKDELDIEGVHNWHNNLKAILSVGICQMVEQEVLLIVLKEKMPNYIATDDCKRLVSDFYLNYSDSNLKMTAVLRNIHSEAQKAASRKVKSSGKTVENKPFDVFNSPVPPKLPKRLPSLLKHVLGPIPALYREAVASACFAPLQTYLSGSVKFKYADNKKIEKSLISLCIAPASIGKDSIDEVVKAIIRRAELSDEENRQKERDYKKACKRKSSNEKSPDRPDDICIQKLRNDFTNAAIVQRISDADKNGKKRMYCSMPEVEGWNKIKKTGGGDVDEFVRKNYDCALHGQERVGTDSVCEEGPLRISWNVSTTPSVAKKYFRNSHTNGTTSRLDTSTIILPEGKRDWPIFGDMDEEYSRGFDFYIDNLMAAEGLIEIPELNKLMKSIGNDLEAYRNVLSGKDLTIYDEYYPRALVIAFMKGALLYLSAGNVWTKEMEHFVRWQVYYNLWVKFHYFYADMYKAYGSDDESSTRRGPQNMLSLLPDTFTRSEYDEMRLRMGKKDDGGRQLNTWKCRRYIEFDEQSGVYTKTKLYTSKFGAA